MRAMMGVLLLAVAGVCSLPLFTTSESSWIMWTSGGVAGFCSAWLWPIVESYLVAGRHGPEMRRAIGWWNLVWMSSVAGVMLAMAPLMENHASMVIVGLGVMNVFALFVLPLFPKNPPSHEASLVKEHVPVSYAGLLQGARVLLPLSYVINGVLSPLLPFILTGIAVDIFWQTPVVAIWMISRVFATTFMWYMVSDPIAQAPEVRPQGSDRVLWCWHGKWSVLWGAFVAMGAGFVCILGASTLLNVIVGLVILGIGFGVTYYTALYYAMAVGSAEVDAGGKHEAFIGGGYMVGPMLGLVSLQFAPTANESGFDVVIYVVLGFLLLSAMALGLFWRKDR